MLRAIRADGINRPIYDRQLSGDVMPTGDHAYGSYCPPAHKTSGSVNGQIATLANARSGRTAVAPLADIVVRTDKA